MIGMLEEAWNLFEKPDMAALSGVPGLGSRVMVIQPSQSVSYRFNVQGKQTNSGHTHEIKTNKSLEAKSKMKPQRGNNNMSCKRVYFKAGHGASASNHSTQDKTTKQKNKTQAAEMA